MSGENKDLFEFELRLEPTKEEYISKAVSEVKNSAFNREYEELHQRLADYLDDMNRGEKLGTMTAKRKAGEVGEYVEIELLKDSEKKLDDIFASVDKSIFEEIPEIPQAPKPEPVPLTIEGELENFDFEFDFSGPSEEEIKRNELVEKLRQKYIKEKKRMSGELSDCALTEANHSAEYQAKIAKIAEKAEKDAAERYAMKYGEQVAEVAERGVVN